MTASDKDRVAKQRALVLRPIIEVEGKGEPISKLIEDAASCPVTSSIEHERLCALAMIYSDSKTARPQKRAIKRYSNNQRDLNNLVPKRHVSGREPVTERFALSDREKLRKVSRAALSAARQAITELGQGATHRLLLRRATEIFNAQ